MSLNQRRTEAYSSTTSSAGPSRIHRTPQAVAVNQDWEDVNTSSESGMSSSTTPKKASSSKRPTDTDSLTSSISRTSSPVKVRTTARAAPSPRRRPARKSQYPPPSPRPREKAAQPRQSPLGKAFGLLFSTLRIAWTIFDWLISPIKPYILLVGILGGGAYLGYCTIIYYLLPRLPTFLFRIIGIVLRPIGSWSLPIPSWETFNLSPPTDSDVGRGIAALSLPISGLATGSCALLGIGCQASLLSSGTEPAGPIWRSKRGDGKPKIGDAQLAWALTQESRSARTIFESISTLGRKADVFEHIEIWKHGVAVTVESKLDDKNVLGKQLFDLGDVSKDLHDEMRKIDSMTVTTFGGLHLEFNDLTSQLMSHQLLDPPDRLQTSVTLARRFDNTLSRLDPKLDDLILRVSRAKDIAEDAVHQSKSIVTLLTTIRHELESEKSSVPAWKRVQDQVGHYINGGDVPRSNVVKRDLKLVNNVYKDVDDLHKSLIVALDALKDYRDQTAEFKASLYGVHLASNGTMDLETELRILAPLMNEFGTSLDAAKERRYGPTQRQTIAIDAAE